MSNRYTRSLLHRVRQRTTISDNREAIAIVCHRLQFKFGGENSSDGSMTFWHYHLILKNIITQIPVSVTTCNRNESLLISILKISSMSAQGTDFVPNYRGADSTSAWRLLTGLRGRRCRGDTFESSECRAVPSGGGGSCPLGNRGTSALFARRCPFSLDHQQGALLNLGLPPAILGCVRPWNDGYLVAQD